VENGARALEELAAREFDLVITDLCMPEVDGMAVLRRAREVQPDTEVLVITGFATVASAVEAMREGAYSYLPKPYRFDELQVLVAKGLEKRAMRREIAALKRQVAERDFPHLIGQGPKILALKESIAQVAAVDTNVLILGETGTGKELVARSIHALSPRKAARFLAVNCASFSEELLVSELFGHEKGAFTGAKSTKKGLMEAADGGTFFLDEIGDMPMPMQVKLLRVLEEKVLMRLGSTEEIPVDIRIVAATNKDLKKEVAAGTFRQDLYYRLNVITLQIPPLSERKEDSPLLTLHFLHKHAGRLGREVREIGDEVMALLGRHEFPGNVRELENIVERAVALCDGGVVQVRHLPPDLQMGLTIVRPPEREAVSLEENEKRHIAWVLDAAGGNRTKTAEILGIDRVSLWRKVKKFGLGE
jgi:DNA-binding NtrC family response regulator